MINDPPPQPPAVRRCGGGNGAAFSPWVILIFVLLVLLILSAPARVADLDIPRLVDALRMKESGLGWNGRPGPGGELSAWQITECVWRQHMMPLPFSEAHDPELAHACAVKHVRWLVAQIERHSLVVTPQRVATAWHFGISHAAERTEWGMEVANLYFDITRSASDRDVHAHQSGYFPLKGSRAEQRPSLAAEPAIP